MIRKLWQLDAETTDPYQNIAAEKLLAANVRPGECILFLWQNENTVVIGRNQNAFRECRITALEKDGGHLARRFSGGGAVYHDLGNLNYSFLVRRPDYDVNRQMEVILRALRSLGVPAEKTGRNDLAAGGSKLSGNAFYYAGNCCCHHGTLLLDADIERMERFLQPEPGKLAANGVKSVRSRVGLLKNYVPELTIPKIKNRICQAFSETFGLPVSDYPAEQLPEEEISLLRQKLCSGEWLYGRKNPLSESLEGRFPWGGIRIEYRTKNGRITEAAVWSDALDADWIESLASLLPAQEASADNLCRQIRQLTAGRSAPDDFSLRETMSRDIENLIAKALGENNERNESL